jgi:hypothetical protein
MKGALAGALGFRPGADEDTAAGPGKLPVPGLDDEGGADTAEPNDLELAAAEEFQKATKSGTAADIVRAFRGLKSACEADYGDQ